MGKGAHTNSGLWRFLKRVVALETVLSLYERAHQAWDKIPSPIRSGIRLAMIWLLSWFLTRWAQVRGWAESLSEFALIQVVMGVLLISIWVLIVFIVRHGRYRTAPALPSPTTGSLARAPGENAPYEAVEKLREIIKPCVRLLRSASSFYSQLFGDSWWPAHVETGLRQTPSIMIEDLFRRYELSPFQETVRQFAERSPNLKLLQGTGRLTQQQFDELLSQFCEALKEYNIVMRRLYPVIEVFGADDADFLSSYHYVDLYNLHSECVPKLQVASERGDLRPLRRVLPTVELVKPTVAVPRLILDGEDAFYVKRVEFKAINAHREKRTFDLDVLTMRVLNAGRKNGEGLVARDLEIEFTCEGPGADLPWISARLDDSVEPALLRPGEKPERVFRLEPSQTRQVNLIIKSPNSNDCYLFNNESYQHPNAQNPAWRMPPGEHRCLAKVNGIDLRESFECIFINHGEGSPLKVKSFRRLPKERDT